MITSDNCHKLKKIMPVISQQVDLVATGANVHRLKNHLCILSSCIWFLSNRSDIDFWLDIANKAKKNLEHLGVHFSI